MALLPERRDHGEHAKGQVSARLTSEEPLSSEGCRPHSAGVTALPLDGRRKDSGGSWISTLARHAPEAVAICPESWGIVNERPLHPERTTVFRFLQVSRRTVMFRGISYDIRRLRRWFSWSCPGHADSGMDGAAYKPPQMLTMPSTTTVVPSRMIVRPTRATSNRRPRTPIVLERT